MSSHPTSPALKPLSQLLDSQKVRYLVAGAWNTLFGYGIYVALYYVFHKRTNYFVVAVVSNVIAISMAYLTHKFFVFKTKGNYLIEYIKFYGVYGASALVGLALLPILIEFFGISPYLAPLFILILSVIFSYFAHKHFSFRPPPGIHSN